MISTKGLTHVQLTVRDLERSLAFYTRVFGLKEQATTAASITSAFG